MKIVDAFMFYNELELLGYRLNLLYDIVSYFIIVESRHTFVGREKKLWYEENKHMFVKYVDKIIHLVIEDFPHVYPDINIGKNQQWVNENFQRNSILKGIAMLNVTPDIIMITDLDEIPDPDTLHQIKDGIIPIELNSLSMDFYYYSLLCRFQDKWTSGKIMGYSKMLELTNSGEYTLTDIRLSTAPEIKRGGWHLSYFGDAAFIKNKIASFSHQEYNNISILNNIESRISSKVDLFGRNNIINKISLEENDYLPPNFQEYLSKYC